MDLDPDPPEGRGDEWEVRARKWGPVWSAIIGPWISWYAFLALDNLPGAS